MPGYRRCLYSLKSSNPLVIKYHNEEWGVPIHDCNKLFQMLSLEILGAGLRFPIILLKRERLLEIWDNFDPQIVSQWSDERIINGLEQDGGIAHFAKLMEIRNNASIFLQMERQFGSFDQWLWDHLKNGEKIHQIIVSRPDDHFAVNELSIKIANELISFGMQWVGSGIIGEFLYDVGIAVGHQINCPLCKSKIT